MTDWQLADRARHRVPPGVEVHAAIESTNDRARALLRRSDADGGVVVAEEQTAGRGRLGRTWTSPPGVNLMCSIAVRPRLLAGDAWRLAYSVGLAARDACAAHARVALKWPNDIVSPSGDKLGGVLVETVIEGDRVGGAVIGIGINVNWPRREMPEEIAASATSLCELAGTPIDRAALLSDLLDRVDSELVELEAGASPLPRYRAACSTLGEDISVETAGGRVEGRASGIAQSGALVVQVRDGSIVHVTGGDVLRLRSATP